MKFPYPPEILSTNKTALFYKLFSVLLFLSVFWSVNSQVIISGNEVHLESELSGANSYEVKARDQIIIQPGFSYTPGQGNNLVTQIDPWYMEPVGPENITGGPGGEIGELTGNDGVVGAIPGSFAASPSGAATYTIPIECPPGMGDMTPSLALMYNSQAGNGIAGWGWNIGGLSAISRVQKTFYHDGETKGIQWDDSDVFALDGQRLFVVNNYTDSVEYRLENDPKPKIMGYQVTESGPGWFKVWDGSGVSLHYETAFYDSYYLSHEYNNVGNYIEYEYAFETLPEYKDFRIQQVRYGNIETQMYSITFEYTIRNDIITGYLSGISYSNNKLLSEISIKYGDVNGSDLKKYILAYNSMNYSFLHSVQLVGMDDEKFNKTVFTWSDNSYNIHESAQHQFENPTHYYKGYIIDDRTYYSADFTGNGLADVLGIFRYIQLDTMVNKSSFLNYKYSWAVFENSGNDTATLLEIGSGSLDENTDFYFFDSDLDGKEELYFQAADGQNNVRFNCYEFTEPTGMVERKSTKDLIIGLNGENHDHVYLVSADFEGDGYPDFLLLKKDDNSYVNSSNFHACNTSAFGSSDRIMLVDFNGNGKTDILFLKNYSSELWEYCQTGVS